MFSQWMALFNSGHAVQAWAILGMELITLALYIWVSAVDIIRMKITFWKLILTGSFPLVATFAYSFFCGCPHKRWFLLCAIALYAILLFANVMFNRDRFIGRGDVDIAASILSLSIGYSAWVFAYSKYSSGLVQFTYVWYRLLSWLLAGFVLYLIIFLLKFIICAVIHHNWSIRGLMKSKVPLIPAFIPAAMLLELMVLLS
jgi:hypothetical protein